MATIYNMWLSMSEHFKSELWPYIRDEPPTQPVDFPVIADMVDITREFFRGIQDAGSYERLFKPWPAGGRVYKAWSFYTRKPEGQVSTIRADLDMLTAAYPQDFSVLGAWNYETGEEVGNPPWYPIPQQTLNFMPDVYVLDSFPPEYVPATELTDVVSMSGQHARSFASYEQS